MIRGISQVKVNNALYRPNTIVISESISEKLFGKQNPVDKVIFRMLHGRGFSKDFTSDSTSIVLNEKAVRDLGYRPETAVGKYIF